MAKTKHIQKRISQRGITNSMLEITNEFGQIDGDKYILSRKNTAALLKALDRYRKILIKIMDKGGLVVVEKNNAQITAYNLNSNNPKLKLEH